jgi:hypothetical protein
MKKTLLALLVASVSYLPSVSQATSSYFGGKSSFFDIASLGFTATSASSSFLLSWEDLISSNSKKGWTVESDGKYAVVLTDSDNKVVYKDFHADLGDVGGSSSGGIVKSFSSLSAGASYTLSLIGKWTGPNGIFWSTTAAPSVSISAVPEPETYAMFLAGLGFLGVLVNRRRLS